MSLSYDIYVAVNQVLYIDIDTTPVPVSASTLSVVYKFGNTTLATDTSAFFSITATGIRWTLDSALLTAANSGMTYTIKDGVTAIVTGVIHVVVPYVAPGGGGGAPTGAAGGDLGSTYPNPTVVTTHLGSALPVAQGGTGAATLTGVLKGNGTGAFTAATAGTDFTTPSSTETQTNKTLTSPTLNSPVINTPTGIVKGDVGLGNVDNTSDATKNSAAVTLTNKTIAGGSNTISGLTVAQGGTGVATLTGVLKGNGTSAITAAAQLAVADGGTGASTLTGVLKGNGTGAVTAAAQLAVADGGTGASTLTGILKGNGTGAFTAATAGSDYMTLASSGTVSNKTYDNTNTYNLKDTLFTLQDDGDATKQAQFQLSGISTGTTRTYTLPDASSTLQDIATAQNVTNKTLDNTNTITLKDTLFTLQDDGDTTKQARFQLSGLTTGQTRTYTLPDASLILASRTGAETMSNKTLTTPVITSISNSGTITIPTGTDTLVARATTDTLTNKRVTKRVVAVAASSNTYTINGDTTDIATFTLAATNTIAAPSGTPVDGDMLTMLVSQDGTGSRTVTWNAIFTFSSDLPQPTLSTGASKVDRIAFMYNVAVTKWQCIGVIRGF